MLANEVRRSWGAQSAAAAAVEEEVPGLGGDDGDEVEEDDEDEEVDGELLDPELSPDELLRESVL
jgi:hypothetical protein